MNYFHWYLINHKNKPIVCVCVYRYGGISVGGVNSQVKMNESEITAVITDLKSAFNISQVRPTEAEEFRFCVFYKNNISVLIEYMAM